MPQLQVFFLAMPATILIGMLLLLATVGVMMSVSSRTSPRSRSPSCAPEPMADEPDSDDRTEEPTQRKLDEAIKRGDVAKSQEINTLFVLGGFTLALMMLSGSITQRL